MKFLLDRARQAGASSSRIAGVIILVGFAILSALFGARTPVTKITQTRAIRPALAQSTSASCTAWSWTQLSPTGTGPDIDSQQFVSDGGGNLTMFGGGGPPGAHTWNPTVVLWDAFVGPR